MASSGKLNSAFTNILALAGSGLAIVAVLSAYLLQNYSDLHAHWAILHVKTYRALTLASALVVVALLVKHFTRAGAARHGFMLRIAGYLLLLLTGVFIARSVVEINNKLHIKRLPVDAKYKFSTDGVSANAPVWSRHLKDFIGKPNVHALEIGSYEGRSAVWFLENVLIHDTSTITCIDIFEDDFEPTFDANVKASGLGHKLTKLKAESRAALRSLKNNFDFVYIDGSHVAKDVLVDAVLAWDILKPGGLIIFDDYRMRRSPQKNQSDALIPEPAIDAFLKVFQPYIDVVHQDYQLIVKKKLKPDFGGGRLFYNWRNWLF